MSGEVATEAEQSSSKIMRTPRNMDLEITSRCNLRCRYCYYFDNAEVDYHDLPTDEWLKFFDELGQCAVMDVTIQGGEPFIRKDLPELLKGIIRNGMRYSILTTFRYQWTARVRRHTMLAVVQALSRVQYAVFAHCSATGYL